jgi:hypothetical protein
MTTHDHPILTGSQRESQTAEAGTAPASEHTGPAASADPSTVPTAPSPRSGVPSTGEAPVAPARHSGVEHESSTEQSLFADEELAELRARWAAVQAAFVDDPEDCVHKADLLVSDLVDQLTTGFADARSRLEEQWARGEEASTEDLRLALMHYREFFERLLAV